MSPKEIISADDDDWSDVGDIDDHSGVIALETTPAVEAANVSGDGGGGDVAEEIAAATVLGTFVEVSNTTGEPPAAVGGETREPNGREGEDDPRTAAARSRHGANADAQQLEEETLSAPPDGPKVKVEAAEPGGVTRVEVAAKEAACDEEEAATETSGPPSVSPGGGASTEGGSAKIDDDADAIPDTVFFAGVREGVEPPPFEEGEMEGDGGVACGPWTVSTTGLYGGGGGGRFNDVPRRSRRILEVSVNAGAIVDGLRVLYSDGTLSEHGGDGGGWRKFSLAEGEGIVEATVRYGRFVQSVEFWTNMGRMLGPCGAGGFFFGLGRVREVKARAPEGHVLAGMHGRRGKYIDGIGFHWVPVAAFSLSRAVPWAVLTTGMYGGSGGGRFNDVPCPSRRIVEVNVNSGAIVDGLRILYSDGTVSEHGGDGGGWRKFPLVEGEGIIEATVRYGRFVQSVEFRTNKGRTLGPSGAGGFFFGLGQVREVKKRAPEGHVLAGIHGRRGKYIDGIGFHWGCMTT